MIDLAQAAALNERLLKLLRLMRQVFQPPLAPGHDCAFDKIFGGLFGCLGGHRHIYSVRAVQDHFAVLGGNFGRLVVGFLIAHGGRSGWESGFGTLAADAWLLAAANASDTLR